MTWFCKIVHDTSDLWSLELWERRALRPDAAVVADDGSYGEVLALVVDVAHQMVIYICLPRHFLSSSL